MLLFVIAATTAVVATVLRLRQSGARSTATPVRVRAGSARAARSRR